MDGLEEMERGERGLQFLDHAVVDEDRAEERGFRLDVRGQGSDFRTIGTGKGNRLDHKRRTMLRQRCANKSGGEGY
ncbi:hypothetical protein NRB_16870 [Novosphingobium sp. 11B]